METREQAKQRYISAATLSSKSLAEGDHRTANRQARILGEMERKMREGTIDKTILVELLNHQNTGVSGMAAADLLRLGYEIRQAEATLERIASMDDTGKEVEERLRVFAAGVALERWRTEGNLD